MNVLIINPIMYTCDSNDIRKVNTLKDTLMYNVCLGFLKNGDTPVLIVAEDFKPIVKETYPFEIIYFETKLKKVFIPRFIPYLKGLKDYLECNISEFDYAICSEAFSISSFTTMRVFKNKCIIWQEMAKHQKKFHKLPSKIWHNIVVRYFYKKSLIVPRSIEARNFISKYNKNIAEDIIEHGMSLENFSYEKDCVEKQFIVVSQLVERKQINKIIYMFNLFLNKYDKSYKLVICGEGNQIDILKKQCMELDILHNVVFLGQCDHKIVSKELSKSKAMLIYTKKDNNMVSIIESIASGTPVVTTSIPYNSSYIKKESLGIVSDFWNEDDLYELCKNFNCYKDNCINYRYKLSSQYTAESFKKIINRELKGCIK